MGDGYCSLEQADMIQQYVEKKIHLLYKIDETIGKSLLKNDEYDAEKSKDRRSMIISDDENSSSPPLPPPNGLTNRAPHTNDKPLTNDITNSKHLSFKKDMELDLSPPLNTNSRLSQSPSAQSPSRGHLSPGEITKAMSPSSLSEASPILD